MSREHLMSNTVSVELKEYILLFLTFTNFQILARIIIVSPRRAPTGRTTAVTMQFFLYF